jgi:uncharacterized protein YndB with AHSA1/START domain
LFIHKGKTVPNGEAAITCVVAGDPDSAFNAFTGEIDHWWSRGPDRQLGSIVRFEADRLVVATPQGVDILATVTEWDPPHRLQLDWLGPHSREGDTVMVTFEAEETGTRVTVHHRRAGLKPQETDAAIVGLWWGDLLGRLQARRPRPPF